MTLWKECGVLNNMKFEYIQDEVNKIRVAANIGRIPHKKSSNFSGFTTDQWKNWICICSTLCLRKMLPTNQYECWVLFQDACCLLLQPSISHHDLKRADEKLIKFCRSYEAVYGKEKCTPNMHMHLHLCKSVENYGPACAFWCFPFERYMSFQKNGHLLSNRHKSFYHIRTFL